MQTPWKALLLALPLALAINACHSGAPTNKDAQYYFLKGEESLEDEDYSEAVTNFEKVRDSFYSPELTALADLKIAEAYYSDERYVEAAAAYEDFLKQHPAHPQTALIIYQLGMSYFEQRLSEDRDQTTTHQALETFRRLQREFPNAPQTYGLEEKINQCLDLLAEHEFYVGRFYLRTKQYPSAIDRLTKLIQQYPKYPAMDKVYFHLAQAYEEYGQTDKALALYQNLGQTYPNSEYGEDAKEYLNDHPQ